MYDIKPLEDEWKRYKSQQRKPWVIFTIFFVFLGFGFIFFFYAKLFDFSKLNSFVTFHHTKIIETDDEESKNVLNGALVILESRDPIIVSTETIDIQKDENLLVDLPILDKTGVPSIKSKDDIQKKRVYINIIETSNVTAYKDVERRFNQSHDTDDSLFLAQSYYKKGNFKKAERWAYETNKINSNLSEALFIFIKSKVKLGKKNEALGILQKYIKKTNSEEAKKLLSEIENKKFN